MRVGVRLHRVAMAMVEPLRISNGVADRRESIVVEVQRAGLRGFGEAAPMPGSFYAPQTPESSWLELNQRVAPAFLSWKGTLDRQALNGTLQTFLTSASDDPFARAGLEGACWDLVCQETGLPLFEALGSTRRLVPSATGVGICDTIEELLYRVQRCLDHGYLRIKIKIQPGWDIEPVRAIRDRFGEIPLTVDANAAYTFEDAAIFRELDRFHLLMIEQPLAASALQEMAELQCWLKTPICVDESADSLMALKEIIRLGSARILNIKIQRAGGIGPALEMYQTARASGLVCWVGTMPELGVASAQALHFATLPGFTEATDVGPSSRWYDDDIVDPMLELDGTGHLSIAEGPGNGFRTNERKLEQYATARADFN